MTEIISDQSKTNETNFGKYQMRNAWKFRCKDEYNFINNGIHHIKLTIYKYLPLLIMVSTIAEK